MRADFLNIDTNAEMGIAPSFMQRQPAVATASHAEVAVADLDHFQPWADLKTQPLTLDQLRQTNRELNNGVPMNGIHHYDLVEQVLGIISDNGYQGEVFDMFAAKAGSTTYPGVSLNKDIAKTLDDPNAELNIRAFTIRRLYSTIHIKGFGDGESEMSLAVSYHQQGIQVAIGRNVRICHNQMILGAERSFQTDRDNDFHSVLDRVATWMQNIRHICDMDDEKIERMKRTVIPPAKVFLLVGMLTATRVACDSSIKEVHLNATYPLNNWQINQLTEKMLLANARNKQVTVYDFYDAANEMYKPHLMDTTQLFAQNIAMVNFLEQYAM